MVIALALVCAGLPTARAQGAGSALGFDGVDDVVIVPDDPSLDLTSGFTLEAWVRPHSFGAYRTIIHKSTVVDEVNYWLASWTDEVNSGFRTGGWWEHTTALAQPLVTDRWYHLVATFDDAGNAYEIFVDGVSRLSALETHSLTTNNSGLAIGDGQPTNNEQFDGVIDEVRVWNRALTQGEIRTGMHRRLTGAESGLVGYWRFDEASGGSASDDGPFSNDGTLTNMSPATDWLTSTAPIGDASIVSAGNGDVSETASVQVDVTWSDPPGASALFAAIQIDDTPSDVTGLPGFVPARYWELWVTDEDAFDADVTFHFDGLAGLGRESFLELYTRADAVSPWTPVGGFTIDTEGDDSDGVGSVTATGLTSFSQFIVVSPVTISGAVFEDADFDGTAGAYDLGVSDAPLPNVDVELYDADDSDSFVASATTDASGLFVFSNVPDGNYKVRARSLTVGDADTPPAGGLNGSVPGTWPYPLAELTWANGASAYGGQDAMVDDTDVGNDAGPGDTWVAVSVSGVDVVGVDFGFAYNLIVNTRDDGNADGTRSDQGSLRQFLKNANGIGTSGGTTANASFFRIPTTDPGHSPIPLAYTISTVNALPVIVEAATVDAATQPDFAGDPVVELDGNGAGGGVDGLVVAGGGDFTILRGFILKRFGRYGIAIQSGADDVTVAGNWIGVDGGGASSMGNGNNGIDVRGADAIIGGTSVLDRNVITNNGNEGINLTGGGATGAVIRGNFIGLNPDGTTGGGNTDVGIAVLSGASGTTIGGNVAGAGNVISMNFEGIEVNTSNNVIQGNYIGTDSTGVLDRGQRSDDGIEIQNGGSNNLIGGTVPEAANVIAFNQLRGVTVKGGSDNSIIGNRIHSNNSLGIDLANDGVTGNDEEDDDSGPNGRMNFPEITSITNSGGNLTIDYDLEVASGNYRIEFFLNATSDPTGYGEGETYLGFDTISHGPAGPESFTSSVPDPGGLTGSEFVTGTTTRLDGSADGFGSTSEFSQGVNAPVSLTLTKRAFLTDGTPLTSGMDLPAGTRVRYLLYINNLGGPVADVSIQDALDAEFLYLAGTVRWDDTVVACATTTCTPAEENAILAAVNAGTVASDVVDGDVVSVVGQTLDAGDQVQANARLDIPGSRVWAVAFTVKMD